MRLILHIFRKDVRRLAPPIVALIAIEATVAYSEIQKYTSDLPILPHSISQSNLFVLPFAWIFLIAAVVLQERLPGTHQYWLTRPIGWPKLLAAKLIFVAVFINAVWFLSDCVILLSLHLPINPVGLFVRQVPLTVLLFLPAFCLASVAGGLGQIALGLIVAVFGFVLDVLVPALLSSHGHGGTSVAFTTSRLASSWPAFALPSTAVFIIIFQFARRATLPSRLLFLVQVFLIPLAFFAILGPGFTPGPPLSDDKPDDGLPAMKISFDFDSRRRPTPVSVDYFEGLQFPVQIDGLPTGAYVDGSGTGEGSGLGKYWIGAFLYHDEAGHWLRLPLDNERLTKVPRNPASLKASLNISTFKVEKTQTVPLRTSKYFSPASGVCCRPFSFGAPFSCWSGPQREHSVHYRAFVSLDQANIELHESRSDSFFESGLPWTFSPIVSWELPFPGDPTKLRGALKPDTQAKFLTLAPTGTATRKLQAEKIDLTQYLVKP